MQRATADRIDHVVTAGAVLLAHCALIWIVVQLRVQSIEQDPTEASDTALPVLATLIDRPRNLSLGMLPVKVIIEDVLHLQRLAPKVPDIPVEASESTAITEMLPQPASVPIPQHADAGFAGDDLESSAQSGGGHTLTVLKRVIPRYPAVSARHQEEGATGMQVLVDENGDVTDVKIARTSGSRHLDDAAMEAVRKWKFSRTPPGAAPDGLWVATELRFVLYRFTYSRLDVGATRSVYVEEVKTGAPDEPSPGSEEALTRFIADVNAGAFSNDPILDSYEETQKMRAALKEWGTVKSIRFTGSAGEHRWIAYPVGPAWRTSSMPATVEVKWNMFEVTHQHATSEWLIAVDRQGTIWNARASRAPWM